MNNVIDINKNTKVYVDGKITEQVIQILDRLYRKEIEPTTNTALESQIFQSINDMISYYEFNDSKAKENNVGMLYVIEEPTASDLSNVTKAITTMTRKQQLNSAVITNSNNLIKQEIQKVCNERLIPVFESLDSYNQYKG